ARTHWVTGPVLNKRTYLAVQGRVINIDRSQSEKPRITLDQVVLDGIYADQTPNRVRIALHGQAEQDVPLTGQVVMLAAHLSPPPGPAEPHGFDFQRFAWFKQLGAVGYTRSPVMLWERADADVALWIMQLRKRIGAEIVSQMPARTAGVAVAITTGDRMYLDEQVVKQLRHANLAHLLAISGLHMGLLTSLIFLLVRGTGAAVPSVGLHWPLKKISALCAVAAGTIYLFLSGASVATERAFIMAVCMFGAILIARRAVTLRAVAMAAFIVLLLRPEVLLSPGFQMSFSATLALVVMFDQIGKVDVVQTLPKWIRYLIRSVASAAIAGGATAPFAAAHFNMIPHYGIVANVLAIPIMGLVVMPGAILATILTPVDAAWIGLWVMDLGLGVIIDIATWTSGVSGAVSHVKAPPNWATGAIALGG
ncbi:MAG: ComEC/Rec2 family competence protein, partial [Planktomarina sp.]